MNQPEETPNLSIIHTTFDNIAVGVPASFRNLTMFPLVSGKNAERDYLTLDEALSQGVARVAEVSEGGNVPELCFLNEGDMSVLLLDGEELIGAKQDRVLNLSILAPAGKTITIPVSCVEAGRWRYRSRDFQSAGRSQYAKARAFKSDHVSMSLRREGTARSNQSEIWNDLSAKSARMHAPSETGSMGDIYKQREKTVRGFVEALPVTDQQVGAVFVIGGNVAGLDLFDNVEALEKLLPKLVRSYALDALDDGNSQCETASHRDVMKFIESVKSATTETYKAVGLGEDLRITGSEETGGALVVDGRVIHLGAFPKTRKDNGLEEIHTRITRPSMRRRAH